MNDLLPICAVCDRPIDEDAHLDEDDERQYHEACCPICVGDE